MRYFVQLNYDGSPFHGWQRQPNASSVQQTLEEAMETILRRSVSLTGAGRTDTGVNARVMYAHFDSPHYIDCEKMTKALNSILGPAIAIQRIINVADNAHARFDALSRTYKYFITFEKNPFLCNFSWHCPSRLYLDEMNKAASLLLDVADFTSFAKLHADSHTNICDVNEAYWQPLSCGDKSIVIEEPGIVFTITADRFLRNMVRAIVGTLLDVGRGKITVEEFKEIIEMKNRCSAGQSMPPQGLFLWDIRYPYI